MSEIKTIQDCIYARLVVSKEFWKILSRVRLVYFDCKSGIKRYDDLSALLENLASQYFKETGYTCTYNVKSGWLTFIVGKERYSVSICKLYNITHEE